MKKLIFLLAVVCLFGFIVSVATSVPLQSNALATLANSMQPGTWAQLTQTNINTVLGNGPTTGNKLPFASTAKWDGATLHYAGNDHGEEGRYITYSAASNSWTDNGQTVIHIGHNYDHITLDPATNDLYLREYGIWPGGYNVSRRHNGVWSSLPLWSGLPQVAIGTEWWSGALQGFNNGLYMLYNCGNDGGLVTVYDPSTNAWTPIAQGFGGVNTYHCVLEYSSTYNVGVFGGGNDNPQKLWRLNSDRSVTALATPPVGIGIQRANIVADPATGNMLILGSGQFWELDPRGNGTYRQLANPPSAVGNPSSPVFEQMISARINTYGVVAYITCRTNTCNFYLYKHSNSITPPPPPPPSDTTPPTVAITAPLTASIVGGTVNVSATAADNVGVTGVQFKLDGSDLGSTDTSSPYSVSWNTAGFSNASHTLTAVAFDGAGNSTSNSISVTVNNAAPPPPPPSGSSNFTTRCQAVGVIKCVGFDQPSDIAGAYGDNSGALAGGATTPQLDASVKSSGNSSLKFTIPGNVALPDPSGSYFTNFSSDLLTQFGASQTFFVQWRQRFSPEFLTITGGGGPKQAIIGAGDIPGCSVSNSANGQCTSSCTALEVVTQNAYNKGFSQMYNSCTGSTSHGAYSPFEERFGSFDFKLQNARPSPYCLYSQGSTNPKTYLPPAGNCFGYFANEWMTYQVEITTGPRVGDEFTNSFVRMWIARDGQASEQVFNWGPYNLSAGSAAANQRFGKVWLLPYNTGQSSTQSFATAYTWFDELIISTSKIADPAADTIPPPTDTTAPTVSLSAPTAGATLTGTATLTASAADNVGVTSVQFRVDGTAIGVADTTAPYSIVWNTVPVTNGIHSISALAKDAAGNQTISTGISVTVSNPIADMIAPTVKFTNVADNGTFTGNVPSFTISAIDNIAANIYKLELWVDNYIKPVAMLEPQVSALPDTNSLIWRTRSISKGMHIFTAKATDMAGNIGMAKVTLTK